MILDNSDREMISHEIFSCIIFYVIYATTYAQTPLRMHKTPPDVMLTGAWNNLNTLETVVIKLNTPDIPGYTTKINADMRQAITNHQADLKMVQQISWYGH